MKAAFRITEACWPLSVVTLLCLTSCASPEASFPVQRGDEADAALPPVEDRLPASCQTELDWPAEVRVGVTPYVGAAIAHEQFEGVVAYLTVKLGRPVRFVSADGYEDLVAKVERKQVDIASLAPLSYVLARQRVPCLRLLLTQVAQGSLHYASYIMVGAGSEVTSLDGLRGHPFAFTSRDSASGYLFPTAFLLHQGVSPEQFFSRVEFAGDHLAAVLMLVQGKVDAIASFARALSLARSAGIDTGNLRVLAVAGRVPYDAVVARPGLNRALADGVQQALLELNATTEEGRRVLGANSEIGGWVRTTDALYDPIRENLRLVEGGGNR
jgi:phosphonate transport system substrate-binding protein